MKTINILTLVIGVTFFSMSAWSQRGGDSSHGGNSLHFRLERARNLAVFSIETIDPSDLSDLDNSTIEFYEKNRLKLIEEIKSSSLVIRPDAEVEEWVNGNLISYQASTRLYPKSDMLFAKEMNLLVFDIGEIASLIIHEAIHHMGVQHRSKNLSAPYFELSFFETLSTEVVLRAKKKSPEGFDERGKLYNPNVSIRSDLGHCYPNFMNAGSEYQNTDFSSAFISSIRQLDLNCAKFFVRSAHIGNNKIDVNALDRDGNNALHLVINRLMGQSMLLTTSPMGEQEIHYLYLEQVYDVVLEIVQYLVDLGVRVDQQNQAWITPIHLASMDNLPVISMSRVLKALLKNKVSVNLKDRDGNSPILFAQSSDTFKTLVYGGADVNFVGKLRGRSGNAIPITALSQVVLNACIIEKSLARFLNDFNHNRNEAAFLDLLESIKFLLNHGANLDLANSVALKVAQKECFSDSEVFKIFNNPSN